MLLRVETVDARVIYINPDYVTVIAEDRNSRIANSYLLFLHESESFTITRESVDAILSAVGFEESDEEEDADEDETWNPL